MADTLLQQLAKTGRNPVQETQYQELLRQDRASRPGASTGSASVPFDANAFLEQQKAQGEALRTKQSAEEDALFKTFETKQAAQPKLSDIYSNLLTEKGITGLETKQTDILNMIDALSKDVTTRTASTFTNEAQRRRLYASELQPLTESLTPISRSLATGREDVSTTLQLRSKEQEKELETDRMRIAATSDRFSRETTGYTQDRQDALSFLLSKIQRDQTLSDRDWQSAQDLAKSERDWDQTKKQMELESINAIKLKQTSTPKAGGGGGGGNPFLTPRSKTPLGTGKTQNDWDNLLNKS